MISLTFLMAPVGLGATLIVAGLIAGRAGPWRRPAPPPPLMVGAEA
jgi:hypothetical protein